MKAINLICGVLAVLFCSCDNKTDAQNLALNKPYTVSPAPNYSLTSTDVNHTVLTDGVYTSGFFWSSTNTVGWVGAQQINIDIDLKQASTIDKVTFNTARGNTAGVDFPEHIFVFVSNDKVNYAYKGDAAADPNNLTGAYEVRKFTLAGVNQKAQYVKLVVMPKGTLLFCDEIEVIAGSRVDANSGKTFTNDDLNKNIYTLLTLLRYERASKKVAAKSSKAASITESLAQAETDRLHDLQQQYKTPLIIDKVNPWGNITTPYKPGNTTDHKYNFSTVINGNEYGAFAITNLSNAARSVNCVIGQQAPAVSGFKLYTVPFVVSGHNYSEVADPVVLNNEPLSLKPGESRVFLFKITGKASGQSVTAVKIESQSFTTTLSVNVNVLKDKFNAFSLNAVNWAYLTYPQISDRNEDAINDLLAHDINTMVVPPNIVPVVGNTDFRAYNAYIAKLKPFKKLLLFANFVNKDNYKGTTFMSDEWKNNFTKWYQAIMDNSKAAGFSKDQLYIYPFDEVPDKYLDDDYEFLSWVKTAFPEMKTFGTLNTVKSISKVGSLLSVSQIDYRINGLLNTLKSNSNQFWFYETDQNSELLSPYGYYRLLAWQVFVNGGNGVGFWNYTDYRNGSDNKLRVGAFDGPSSVNFSVIYNGPGTSIISSRRWEAFREGIEDYELLKKYAQKNGAAKAKALAESVINNPDDNTKADAVRNEILQSIGK